MGEDRPKFDPLEFASLVAHQLQSPIASAGSIVKSMLGGYLGPLTDQQRDSVAKVAARCDQAIESVRRVLSIAKALQKADLDESSTDVTGAVRQAYLGHREEASTRGISLTLEAEDEPLYVRVNNAALAEALEALVGNALKYTPAHGRIRISEKLIPDQERVCISVSDSGVGIPEQEREKVFEPFYRSSASRGLAQAGTGLGLTFVKTVVEAARGHVSAGKADLGGAEIVLNLPLCRTPAEAGKAGEETGGGMKVVIIGGVAAGPKVASKVIRLDPTAEVTIVDKGKFLSYAGCGLPYYVSGVVSDQRELMSTPVGVMRDAVFFQKVRNVHVSNDTEALKIDRQNKRVLVEDCLSGRQTWLDYDKLVLATGGTPVVPSVPGVDLLNIFTLHGVYDAEGIRAALADAKARDVVIIGGGIIGVELTGPLAAKGCRVSIVETLPQILPILDWEMAKMVEQHLEGHGVRVLTEAHVTAFEGDGKVARAVTNRASLPADLVILATGLRPNVELAKDAGLEIGTMGGVAVDEHLRTSDPDIYAAGDCVENLHIVTGQPCYIPLGSTANRQGRVVALNICGTREVFPGVVGSMVCKVFDYCVARTGLTESEARRLGYQVTTALTPGPDAEHFMPTARQLMLKMVVDSQTRRLLGVQGIGPGRADKRIDVAAMAIMAGLTVDDLANADLCYAPQYSPALDNIVTAANVVRNKMAGHLVGISAAELRKMLDEGREFVLLDVRTPGEYEQVRLPGASLMPLGALRGRLSELPKDKEIVTVCNISLRSYEAALVLRSRGFENVRVLEGGIDMWPYSKLH